MSKPLSPRSRQVLVLATLIGLPNVGLVGAWQVNRIASQQGLTKRPAACCFVPLLTTENGHYARNRRNNPPQTEADAIRLGWVKMPDWANAFHRRGVGNEQNKKYVPPRDRNIDRGMEAIYDKHGNLVTDEVNGGTYNYVAPAYPGDGPLVFVIRGSGHLAVDVLPYLALGNAPKSRRI
jgi:hypothetical protein